MRNFFFAFVLAVLVVLSSVTIRRSVVGIGVAPMPIPPMSHSLGIGVAPMPIPPMMR